MGQANAVWGSVLIWKLLSVLVVVTIAFLLFPLGASRIPDFAPDIVETGFSTVLEYISVSNPPVKMNEQPSVSYIPGDNASPKIKSSYFVTPRNDRWKRKVVAPYVAGTMVAVEDQNIGFGQVRKCVSHSIVRYCQSHERRHFPRLAILDELEYQGPYLCSNVSLFFRNKYLSTRSGNLYGRFQNSRLPFHLIGLGLNGPERPSEQTRLPEHGNSLQKANNDQTARKPFEFPLYIEILLFGIGYILVAAGGCWFIYGRGLWTVVVVALGFRLLASCITSAMLCDPIFYRVGWHALRGHSADRCQCSKNGKYRPSFQHNSINVSQKHLTSVVYL